MFWDQTLIQLFKKGGFAMWPLLFCSIVGTAIVIERSIYFFRLRLNYEAFIKQLKGLVSEQKMKEALTLCRRHANPIPRIALLYLKNLEEDSLRRKILTRESSFALEQLETRLRWLATITHIAPLLGLLGTVTGLVSAFHQIEILGGQVQAGDLAGGIWEALITTVFGLMIAIPSMAAYHGFEGAVDSIARRMQFIISELDEFFGKESNASFTSQDTEATEETMKAFQ